MEAKDEEISLLKNKFEVIEAELQNKEAVIENLREENEQL